MRSTARRTMFVAALGLAIALANSARADTVSGRITYLDLGAHELMLDNSELYAVASDIAPTGLEVGRLVTLEVEKHGTTRLVTKVDKYT